MSQAILLNVDDNDSARYARTRGLQRAGFTVHEACNGTEALELVTQVNPDLILLDVNLPDIHGIEVCRRVKKSPSSAAVMVLQVSASAIAAPQATEALNNGADGYLTEPVDLDVLVATVRALLRLRTAERDLAKSNADLQLANKRLKETNHALRRSNEDLEHFAYVASHDLQEPLRTISTHVQLLDRLLGPRLNDDERERFSFVVDAARRMRNLIDNVLNYSRLAIEAPKLNPVALDDALAWGLDNLAESIRSSSAEITTAPLPTVNGDRAQLGQVFQNLIANSIKYKSDAPLRIEVRARPGAESNWIISIRDNGIGIEDQYQNLIFTPFKRLHGREIPGTGIGLALCRRIVESHGGEIWVDSKLGEGAEFSFSLPAVL